MNAAPDEIAKIEHELDILRSRYAIFQRWAQVMKWFFIALAVIISSTIAIYGIVHDPLVAVIMMIVVAAIGGGFYLARNDRERRWIDVVSPGLSCADRKSEASAIETMIDEREKRLAEIKARPA